MARRHDRRQWFVPRRGRCTLCTVGAGGGRFFGCWQAGDQAGGLALVLSDCLGAALPARPAACLRGCLGWCNAAPAGHTSVVRRLLFMRKNYDIISDARVAILSLIKRHAVELPGWQNNVCAAPQLCGGCHTKPLSRTRTPCRECLARLH
jgi:hypothetical protein